MSKYSVLYWGSHPDAGNDDCWSGEDFATLSEAETAFAATPDDLCVTHVMLDSVEVNKVRKVRDPQPTVDDDDEWRREIAREEGMLGGCDAYNEVMGY